MISQTVAFALFTALLACAECRDRAPKIEGGYTGRIAWQTQADGIYTAASEERTVGSIDRVCRLKSPAQRQNLALQMQELVVSFSGKRNQPTGSGLQLQLYAGKAKLCELSFLSIASEDNLHAGGTTYSITVPDKRDSLTLVYRLIDVSGKDPVRIDIRPPILRAVRPGEMLMPCPSTAAQLPADPPER